MSDAPGESGLPITPPDEIDLDAPGIEAGGGAGGAGTGGGGRVLGWAAYLACSWTWCIGMFLPVLLVRDYGVWGFVVFAAPNVIGAAAMGWVLRSRDAARRIVEDHAVLVRSFSWVTIAFHCFFLGWIATMVAPHAWLAGGSESLYVAFFAALIAAAGVISWLVIRGRAATASLAMWVISLSLGLLMFATFRSHDVPTLRPAADSAPLGSVMFLAPVCVFGFALCPYLDATFLLARRSLDRRPARAAFGVGFGILFFTMILLTLGYSTVLRPGAATTHGVRLAVTLFPHFVLQSVFTAVVHLRALPERSAKRPPAGLFAAVITCCGLAVLGIGASERNFGGMLLSEVIYRGFMSFYGLIFPAYVWICMIPTRSGHTTSSTTATDSRGPDESLHAGLGGSLGRMKLIVWLGSVTLAAPAFWLGFIERQTLWLAPGLMVVLLARVLVIRLAKAST